MLVFSESEEYTALQSDTMYVLWQDQATSMLHVCTKLDGQEFRAPQWQAPILRAVSQAQGEMRP